MIASQNIGEICTSLAARTLPLFQTQASILGNVLKKKTKGELKTLCGVSDGLSTHVKGLYDALLVDDEDDALTVGNKRYNQAALMFDGPAFRGLAANDLSPEEGEGLQKHLRILTGLYGYVRPGDLIQEHRLCMGTKLAVSKDHKNLYEFWSETLAKGILQDLAQQLNELQKESKGLKKEKKTRLTPLLINCASQEYAKCVLGHLNDGNDVNDVNEGENNIRVVECVFLDGGIIKSAFAKRARGEIMMCYIILCCII